MSVMQTANRMATQAVKLNAPRSRWRMPTNTKFSLKSGRLIPVQIIPVLPGDTWKINLASVIREMTPAVPIMDNAYVDFYAFFVPHRIIANKTIRNYSDTNNFKSFLGENLKTKWAPEQETTFKMVPIFANQVESIANYYGIPILPFQNGKTYGKINTIAFAGYDKIYNTFFRDENNIDPKDMFSRTGGIDNVNGIGEAAGNPGHNDSCYKVAKYFDYFTAGLPEPQKGDVVTIPLGGIAPVTTAVSANNLNPVALQFENMETGKPWEPFEGHTAQLEIDTNKNLTARNTQNTGVAGSPSIAPKNLVAHLENATSVSINEISQKIALQMLQQKFARCGTRMFEIYESEWGVEVPFSRIDDPEYLGGYHVPLNMLQVLQQADTSKGPLGSTGAFSNTALNTIICNKSFMEHGSIHILMTIRTDQTYSQGIPRMFSRERKFDMFWPTFANLPEQGILKQEIFVEATDKKEDDPTNPNKKIFAYVPRGNDYRYIPNSVKGYMAPNSNDQLAKWTYATKFDTCPILGDNFIEQQDTNIGNTLAVTEQAKTQFIADVHLDIDVTRVMPINPIPLIAPRY